MTTPVSNPPRYSKALTSDQVGTSEREMFELLQKALEPSFVLVRRIGAGGMGIVYLARDPALKRLVAVKVMSPDRALDAEARARFQREAESVAKIAHPNVVAVYSVGELANGVPYIVMQYVEGRSMAERLVEEGPLDVAETKSVIGQVASALAAAHAKGIVHRDIKSANILWDDAAGRALVSDFGIAALLDREGEGNPMELTQTGAIVGTPKFMSPEQLLSERVSEKTDVYSLGLLSYELLAREGPFLAASSPNQMIVAHLRDAPRPISTLRADVDPSFEALLASCLEKDPHARPDAEDIARRLHHATSVVLEWPPPGLEDLQGAAVAPTRRMVVSGMAVAIPLAVMAAAEPGSPFYLDLPAAAALPVTAIVGGLFWLSGAAQLARLVPLIARAARAGYGWQVLNAVLVDDRNDMGAVIAGDREYAALSSEKRHAIRRWRVARVALGLGAAVWAVAGVLIALPIGARLAGSEDVFAWALLGVPIAAQTLALLLGEQERRLVGPVRARMRKHSSTLDRLAGLASAWTSALDRVAGDVIRAGTGRVARRFLGAAAIVTAALVGAVTVTGLTTIAMLGKVALKYGMPSFNSLEARYLSANRLRYLRPEVDPTITPLAAGEAMYSLAVAGRHRPGSARTPAPREVLPAVGEDPIRTALFGMDWRNGTAMRAAARGLTTAERAEIEKRAALGGRKQLEIMAHAARIDWFSASVPQPVPADFTVMDVEIPMFSSIRTAAAGHVARAVLARADGRNAEAERLLREVIGVGFNLMQGQTMIDNMIGSLMVQMARDNLVPLYETTGRAAEAVPIRQSLDNPNPARVDRNNQPQLSAEQQDARINHVLRDSTALPGYRWEMATRYAAFRPCTELRQIIFGPGPEYTERMDAARRALVKTPGDDALMRVAERTLETPMGDDRLHGSVAQRSLLGFARAVDALTGSRRTSVCTAFLAGMVNPR
jgi:aminoglycoside phosphotransferase (APT) family kinase protein